MSQRSEGGRGQPQLGYCPKFSCFLVSPPLMFTLFLPWLHGAQKLDDPKNEDDLKNENDISNEDNLNNEDNSQMGDM